MKFKKTMKIACVVFVDGKGVYAYARDKEKDDMIELPLTRHQRTIFLKHGLKLRKFAPTMRMKEACDMLDDLEKEFHRADVLTNIFLFKYVNSKDDTFTTLTMMSSDE